METMRVTPAGGERLAVAVRGHEIVVDQPAEAGGTDSGPTPTELFVAGLASCVAVYASRFLARHDVCSDGLRVDAAWEMGEGRPPRVGCVTISITPPPTLPASRLPALLAVSSACTVHNSLASPPAVRIEVVDLAAHHPS
jgi:putative redox protein